MKFTTEIPDYLKHLPVDSRGYPVPYIIFIDDQGKPNFRVNNFAKVKECIFYKKCQICGKPLNSDIWFIGGQLSCFHKNGSFIDPPVHHDCGRFALQVCPYMVNSSYQSPKPPKLKAEDAKTWDPGQETKRLTIFCFVQTKDYACTVYSPTEIYLHPVKPFLTVQYWYEGKQIERSLAADLLQKNKEPVLLPH